MAPAGGTGAGVGRAQALVVEEAAQDGSGEEVERAVVGRVTAAAEVVVYIDVAAAEVAVVDIRSHDMVHIRHD